MAQCTVTCYFPSCMSTVPSITFYTFPPQSPCPPSMVFCVCVCVAAVGQLAHTATLAPGWWLPEGPGSTEQVISVNDEIVWEETASRFLWSYWPLWVCERQPLSGGTEPLGGHLPLGLP